MAQEPPICRFCLDSNNLRTNSLITPCECKGSMRYVHEACLARWRRVNPERNGETCLLCLEPYRREYFDTFEMIPNPNNFSIFLLRFPFIVSLTINYAGLFHYTAVPVKTDIYSFFEYYQYGCQIAYFLLFYLYWNVKQKDKYWKLWFRRSTFFLVGFHILCNTLIYEHHLLAVIPLNFVLRVYWKQHIGILEDISTE